MNETSKGITLEFDHAATLAALQRAAGVMAKPDLLLREIGEELMSIHARRFVSQTSPAGEKWAPLTPRYLKQKKRNKNKILTLEGYLRDLPRYQVHGGELLFGSDRKYAALLHFGGDVHREARQRTVYFKINRQGKIGHRFAKKKNSNFAQGVTVGQHSAHYTPRPWLGTSDADNANLLALTVVRIEQALTRNWR